MITNGNNTILVNKIAAQICGQDWYCRHDVKTRMNDNFSDETFTSSFMKHYKTNRFFFYTFVRKEDKGSTYKIVVEGYDVVTGKHTGHIGIEGVNKSAWDSRDYLRVFASIGRVSISRKPNVGWLVRAGTFDPYGIVFASQQQEPQQTITPGGCPPGTYLFAGECIDPGTGQPVVDPETQQPIMPPQGSGFDLSGILDNPLILIGGAALLFFFFMKD